MAPANGTNANGHNRQKSRIQPVLPALPLIPHSKKASQPERDSQSTIQETPQPDIASSEKFSEAYDTISQESLSKSGEPCTNQQDFSTPSVSAVDESFSAQSSQDPSPAIENDSSVTSALTSESIEATALTSQPPADRSTNVAKHVTVSYPPMESTDSLPGAAAQVQMPKENGTTGIVHTTPNTVSLTAAVSPLTNLSSDKVPVELSTYIPIMAPMQAQTEAMLGAVRPFDSRRFPTPQDHTYPEVTRNGNRSSTHRLNLSNGHHSAASLPKPLPTVLDHLLHLANSKQIADWVIRVDQPRRNIQPFITYAHGFVLLRSDRLRKLMAQPSEPVFNLPVICLTPSRTIQPHAFEAALRFLYSDTVLSAEALFPRDTYMDRHARAHVVDYVLSYWIAGTELELEPVTSRAYALLGGMIDWDIAELLVREALSLKNLAPPRSDYQPPAEHFLVGESILRLVSGLFVHRFDVDHFKLDINSQPATMVSRFAQLDHARTPANPVLAGMVFGSMPSADLSQSASHETGAWSADTVASTILLNMDFADLANLSKDLVRNYGTVGVQIVSDVISEREKRRLQILNNKLITNKERIANPAIWDIIGWQEVFEQETLHRERVGYVLPSKKTRHGPVEM